MGVVVVAVVVLGSGLFVVVGGVGFSVEDALGVTVEGGMFSTRFFLIRGVIVGLARVGKSSSSRGIGTLCGATTLCAGEVGECVPGSPSGCSRFGLG